MHQGDAMGPVGFALGLEEALDNCKTEENATPWSCWYLDDGTIVGTLEGVSAYLSRLQPELLKIGLQVNPAKCTIWGSGVQQKTDMADLIPNSWPLDTP